uniref:Uncharacterized protein n=1 Tax=viral metagenome TaxID=1070528 RepID=A0A6C0BPM1_9ZZZZ
MSIWNRHQNCYAYAFNDPTEREWFNLQPGNESGVHKRGQKADYDCDLMRFRVLSDNGHDTFFLDDCEEVCPDGYHKIAMAVDPGTDYHFFRQDATGQWSHKLGKGKVYKMSIHPWESDRKFGRFHYTDFCGCLCTLSDGQIGFGDAE